MDLDERQYDKGYGPCLDCIETNQPMLIDDMGSERRWPDWATRWSIRQAKPVCCRWLCHSAEFWSRRR